MMELNELLVVYGYMIQMHHGKARRLVELNRRTVMNAKAALEKMHKDIFGKDLTDLEEAVEECPYLLTLEQPLVMPLSKKLKLSICLKIYI